MQFNNSKEKALRDCFVIKCQCCGGCMSYDEKLKAWVCPDCGYVESYAEGFNYGK